MRCRSLTANDIVFTFIPGEGLPEEDRIDPASEHLPATGDRPDAEGADSGPVDTGRPQAGHRRNDYHVREPPRCSRLHVRRTHTECLAQGLSSCYTAGLLLYHDFNVSALKLDRDTRPVITGRQDGSCGLQG